MKFYLRPILSEMKEFYIQPISQERFDTYRTKLEGDTQGDLILPISGYNPMAKDYIGEKIEELQNLESESIMEECIDAVNLKLDSEIDKEIMVVLNLADDYKGAWTNFYSTDFESKFKINALISRSFCAPYFWVSRSYTKDTIKKTTMEYIYRTVYRQSNPSPRTLADHLNQEKFVAQNTRDKSANPKRTDFTTIDSFYRAYQNSEDYNLIFNFFYGDKGSESLGFKKYGIKDLTGFDYAASLLP